MRIKSAVLRQISAAKIRHDMKKKRKSQGLSTDLRVLVAEYRTVCPEYADQLERLIYPKLRVASD